MEKVYAHREFRSEANIIGCATYELKVVEFMPEFAGKLNFYVSAVNRLLRQPEDNPTIGLLICKSKDQTKVKMVHYENHAFYVHEKSFVDGYKFVKLVFRDNNPVYKIEWKSLVAVLESPVIKSISLQ